MPALRSKKPSFLAKYYKAGKFIGKTNRFRKGSLLLQVQDKFALGKIDRIYLKVQYNENKDDYNDGYYENIREFTKAWRAFTSEELIKFINGGRRNK